MLSFSLWIYWFKNCYDFFHKFFIIAEHLIFFFWMNEISCWCMTEFSQLLCQSSSWWLTWFYCFSFWADRTVCWDAYLFESIIVSTFFWFCWTDQTFQFSIAVVNIVLQAVQCVTASELEFVQNYLMILQHWMQCH